MVSPNLSIGPALTLEELGDYQDIKTITLEVIKRARKQLEIHSSQFFAPNQA